MRKNLKIDLEKLYTALQEAEKIFKNAETQLSKVRE